MWTLFSFYTISQMKGVTGAFRAPVLKDAVKTILREYYVEHELDEASVLLTLPASGNSFLRMCTYLPVAK